ncbi:putative quinol monooxygenase [Modestobacter sp. Leaf380]|uniref:putative quinol monooxygenase n=1 Tax=Modestobacter sp. Leaf380 TaxID=1736356 RepID=UPI0006FD26D2|nr:putative quinol monooxygenase [Modestobacter sp. Leaf380]KQS68493.1 antibiotic biosynthesis monooxygenase [Modestobacter sp. Leaf380]
MSITVIATITPKPDRFDAVRQAFEQAVPAVHEEPGCELYALYTGKGVLVMVERWSDGQALEAHGAGETFNALSRGVQDDLAEPLDVQILEPVAVGDPAKGQIP